MGFVEGAGERVGRDADHDLASDGERLSEQFPMTAMQHVKRSGHGHKSILGAFRFSPSACS